MSRKTKERTEKKNETTLHSNITMLTIFLAGGGGGWKVPRKMFNIIPPNAWRHRDETFWLCWHIHRANFDKNIPGQVRSGHQNRSWLKVTCAVFEVWSSAKAKSFFQTDVYRYVNAILPKTCISQIFISVTWCQVTSITFQLKLNGKILTSFPFERFASVRRNSFSIFSHYLAIHGYPGANLYQWRR